MVHHAASGLRLAAVTVTPFNGTLPAADAGCVTHPPFTVGAGVRAVSGFVTSTNLATDLVFELYRVGPPDVLLIHADGGFQPEGFRYSPAGGVPTGDYYVKVCDFPGGGAPGAEDLQRDDHDRRHPGTPPTGRGGRRSRPTRTPARSARTRGTGRERIPARRGAGAPRPAVTGWSATCSHGLRGITTSSPISRPSRPWATTRRPRRTGRTRTLGSAAVLADEPSP